VAHEKQNHHDDMMTQPSVEAADCIVLEGHIHSGHCTCPPGGSMLNSVSGTSKVMPKFNLSLRTECHQRLLLNTEKGGQGITRYYEIWEKKHGVRLVTITQQTYQHNFVH
jgi:hypothetical protein